MNKTAIKNFAIWARNKLIADIQYRAGLMGITANGIKDPLPQSTATMEFYDIGTAEPYAITGNAISQRKRLVEVIRKKEKDSNYATAYKYILEEVAYTWFNRLIAVRFMEVNDYLPSHIRVLSSESGKIEPDLVTTPFDAELNFTSDEKETVLRLKTENKLDELFRLLFIKQCNALNDILPALFEQTNDYTELLLNLSVVDREGVVYHLIHDIEEDDFNIEKGGQVEIIGWLYQYYNTEPKNAAFAKNGKITKEEIPAVTQLFTPDWIVRYMVENSLGRIYIDKRKEQGAFTDSLRQDTLTWEDIEAKRIANEKSIADEMGWKYYLPEAAQTEEVRRQLDEIQRQSAYKDIRDIKVIDPCMGSGHILVYAFDVLMKMYENDGYSQRDAAQCILEHNLFGLDIDERAAQLAYFAVMMKARQYDRRIFTRGIQPHVYAIAESNDIDTFTRDYFTNNDPKLKAALDSVINDLHDAKEYGSILTVAPVDFAALYARAEEVKEDVSLHREAALNTVLPLIRVAEIMAQRYEVVVTNPPYMGSGNMDTRLSEFVKKHYPDSKSDLFAVFIERCGQMTGQNRYQAMITQHAWMFLSSFEKLRASLLLKDTVNMAHLGPRAFEEIGGEVVQTTSFVLRNSHIADFKGTYSRLIEPTTQQGKEDMFLAGENRYIAQQSNFSKISGSPVAYWVSDNLLRCYQNGIPLGQIAAPRKGNSTSDNNRFLRIWFEVDIHTENFGCRELKQELTIEKRWFPYNKGGGYRKWYGYNEYMIDWYDDAAAIRAIKTAVIANYQYFMKPGLTWSTVTSGGFSLRKFGYGYIFDNGGCCIFDLGSRTNYILGVMNSTVFKYIFGQSNPTINSQSGEVAKFPVIISLNKRIDDFVEHNVISSKNDWDSYETSWDFKHHPLLRPVSRLADDYTAWKSECEQRFLQLKANEEELNRIFIDIYGLQDELTPDVAEKDVTVHRIFDTKDEVPESMQGSSYVRTKRDEIVSLLSYAVGCMFGRYSLDVDGLAYAGGEWDASKYKTFQPDRDGILPITDEEYLQDDIISRLCDWLKVAYGADALEENLDFIADALGGKGDSSREIIRNYFLNDFFKDHCKTYQKRPIYWLFDSGKQDGFKALIYLHRYTPDIIGNIRVDYLHKMQRVYESEIGRMQDMIDHSANAREVAASTKRKEKLQKQLKECRDYDEMIAHLALSRIELDLDDGVKVNYEKIQTAGDGKQYPVLAKI